VAADSDVRYAGFGARLLAALVDGLVFVPFMALYVWLSSDSRAMAILAQGLSAVIGPAYHIVLHAIRGQSVGKMAVGIRVVALSGTPIGWRLSILRFSVDTALAIALSISMTMGYLAMTDVEFHNLGWFERHEWLNRLAPLSHVLSWALSLWTWGEIVTLLFNRQRRALHDLIAGTLVVHVPSRRPERSER
jgi:uncharacterized RDD family membrane protein YckC